MIYCWDWTKYRPGWNNSSNKNNSGVYCLTEMIKKQTNGSEFDQKTARRIRLTRFVVFFERLWPLVWPGLAALGLYIAVALFDPWRALSFWVQSAALLTVIIIGYLSLRRCVGQLRWPSIEDASRRLERQNHISHRPLDAVQDKPAQKSRGGAETLWRLHQKRMAASLDQLKAKAPNTRFSLIDPRALRALILILLLVGFVHAGADWNRRLDNAFSLNFGGSPEQVALDIWISPPDYTNRQPIALIAREAIGRKNENPAALQIIAGSKITARLQGGWRTPELTVGGSTLAFKEIADEIYEVSGEIRTGGSLEIYQGSRLRGTWPIEIVPDSAPQAEFSQTPEATARHSLRVDYVIRDDFGVTSTLLSLSKPGAAADTLEIELSGAPGGEAVSRTAYQDLTAHPWAGWTVNAVLTATDALGQTGRSEQIQFSLPERSFTHLVARNIINIRKSLFADPANRNGPARRLQLQARRPNDFNGDLTVFAAMRSAYWRLKRDDGEAALGEVTDLLWDTALRLEDGMVSLAERDLRNALEDLSEALEDGETDSAFDELANALEQSLQNFLSAQMANRQSSAPPPSGMPQQNSQVIGSDMLQQMIQQMRDLAAAGETEAAMEMLNTLREIMENLATGNEPMSAEDYERMMAASEALAGLQQLQEAQQELMNRTARESLLNAMREQIGQPKQGMQGLSREQADLQEALKGLAEKLGEAGMEGPEEMAEAGSAMQGASTSLGKGSGRQAVRGQGEALDALGRALSELESALSQSMQQSQAMSRGIDPFGRSSPFGHGNVELPSASERERVRQILRMLQERIGDPNRPEVEREYLRRLLKRF